MDIVCNSSYILLHQLVYPANTHKPKPEQLSCDTIDQMLIAADWQVQDYFNKFQVGSIPMPDNRTLDYFDQNLVDDYGYEKAVIDGVLVHYNVFTIETKITIDNGMISMSKKVDNWECFTHRKFYESVDKHIEYSREQLMFPKRRPSPKLVLM